MAKGRKKKDLDSVPTGEDQQQKNLGQMIVTDSKGRRIKITGPFTVSDSKGNHLQISKPGPKGTFKRSGHLTDQILKYSQPGVKQLSLFDILDEDVQEKIEKENIERSEIVEGIKLSPGQTKVIDSLCKLLHESSQNSEPNKEDYYAGNMPFEMVRYGKEYTPAPKLAFTLYELTKEYMGGDSPGGKEMVNVGQILRELDNKKFLLSYVERIYKPNGDWTENKIEDFNKLIHIVKLSKTQYSKEDNEISKREETVILLNPIFRRQINSKFILYPEDINRRTVIAYGSHNLSEIALRLRDYLMRELSKKHYEPKITLENLYYTLAEKWMKEKRKKMVKEYTERAIDTVMRLGILLGYEKKDSARGEAMIVFKLNKDWK